MTASWIHVSISIIFVLAVLGTSQLSISGTIPAELIGVWEVTKVAVDTADQPHWRYEPDDPRILGRIMTFGADGGISFNLSRETCDRAVWIAGTKNKLSTLVARTFPRPPHPMLKAAPSLQDFDLKIKDQYVKPWRATCSHNYWSSAWFILLDPRKIMVAYESDTILLLKKSEPSEPAKPSFACNGTLNPSETAICGSAALAGFDRSVEKAYRRSLKRRESDSEMVQEEQRQWVIERNRCKDNAACIEKAMRNRIEVLMQD